MHRILKGLCSPNLISMCCFPGLYGTFKIVAIVLPISPNVGIERRSWFPPVYAIILCRTGASISHKDHISRVEGSPICSNGLPFDCECPALKTRRRPEQRIAAVQSSTPNLYYSRWTYWTCTCFIHILLNRFHNWPINSNSRQWIHGVRKSPSCKIYRSRMIMIGGTTVQVA